MLDCITIEVASSFWCVMAGVLAGYWAVSDRDDCYTANQVGTHKVH